MTDISAPIKSCSS